MVMPPALIDIGTDADAGFWLAALPFVNFPVSEYPAQVTPGPSIRARDTGRRGGFPPVAPSAALSTHVHDSEVHRG